MFGGRLRGRLRGRFGGRFSYDERLEEGCEFICRMLPLAAESCEASVCKFAQVLSTARHVQKLKMRHNRTKASVTLRRATSQNGGRCEW